MEGGRVRPYFAAVTLKKKEWRKLNIWGKTMDCLFQLLESVVSPLSLSLSHISSHFFV